MIAIGRWPALAEAARSATRAARAAPYVEAARLLGIPEWRTVRTHVLPNAAPAVLATLRATVALALLDEAALSFLGAGAPLARPSLGTLVRLGLIQPPFAAVWAALPAAGLALLAGAVMTLPAARTQPP